MKTNRRIEALRASNWKRFGDPLQRFWKQVDKRGPDECWNWIGKNLGGGGYGSMRWNKKQELCHRISWSIHHGEMPVLWVLHECDNKLCVNPCHLFLGTALDNVRDMIQKGRSVTLRGDLHPRRKLNSSDVKNIRQRLSAGEPRKQILMDYPQITKDTIADIAIIRSWKGVSSCL